MPFVLAAYRASVHDSTGFTPNFLVFGAELRAPIDLVLGVPGQEANESYNEFVQQHAELYKEAYTLVWDQLKRSAERRKKDYDLRVNKRSFDVGDWVWYYCPKRVTGRSPKWQRYFSGPYLVVRVIDPVNLVLQRNSKAKTFVVHNDKVKRFQGEPPRSWLDQVGGPSAETSTQQTERKESGDASELDDGVVESDTDPHSSQPRGSPCAERTKRKIIKPVRFRLTRCYTDYQSRMIKYIGCYKHCLCRSMSLSQDIRAHCTLCDESRMFYNRSSLRRHLVNVHGLQGDILYRHMPDDGRSRRPEVSMARVIHSTPNRPVVGFRSTSFRTRSPDSDRSRRSRWSERSRSRSSSRRSRSRTENRYRASRERHSSEDTEKRSQETRPIQKSGERIPREKDRHTIPSESADHNTNDRNSNVVTEPRRDSIASRDSRHESDETLPGGSATFTSLAYQDIEHRVEHDAPRPSADAGGSSEKKKKKHHHRHKKFRTNERQTEDGPGAGMSGMIASSDPPEPPISVDLPVVAGPNATQINEGAPLILAGSSSGSVPEAKDIPRLVEEQASPPQLKAAPSMGSGATAEIKKKEEKPSIKKWPTLAEKTDRKELLKVRLTPGPAIPCGPSKLKKMTVPKTTKKMGPKTKVGRSEGKEPLAAKVAVCIPQADSLLAKQTLEANQALAAVRRRLQEQNERIWAVVAELETEERRRETQLQLAVHEAEASLRRLRELASPATDSTK